MCVCKCTVLGFCNCHRSQHVQQFHSNKISLCCLFVVKPSLCHQALTTSVVFSPFLSFSVSWNITYMKACVNVMFGTGFFFWWHVLVIHSWSAFHSCECCFSVLVTVHWGLERLVTSFQLLMLRNQLQ